MRPVSTKYKKFRLATCYTYLNSRLRPETDLCEQLRLGRASALFFTVDSPVSDTNPTVAEIRKWGYSNAPWPVEEWDLFLSWTGEIDLFIELATDHSCAHRVFFLHMLYYIIGATYTSPRQDDPVARASWYAEKGRPIKHGDIKRWVSNVDSLVKGGLKYRYEDWRGGLLARYEFS